MQSGHLSWVEKNTEHVDIVSVRGEGDIITQSSTLTQPHNNCHSRKQFTQSLNCVRAVLIKVNIQLLSSGLLHYLGQILVVRWSQWRYTVNIVRPETYQLYSIVAAPVNLIRDLL